MVEMQLDNARKLLEKEAAEAHHGAGTGHNPMEALDLKNQVYLDLLYRLLHTAACVMRGVQPGRCVMCDVRCVVCFVRGVLSGWRVMCLVRGVPSGRCVMCNVS